MLFQGFDLDLDVYNRVKTPVRARQNLQDTGSTEIQVEYAVARLGTH
jgi:hypothetical protein